MLERIVVIRFKEEYRLPERLAEIAEHSRKVMPGVPGVREVTVGTAADDATAGAWDLVLVVRLDGMEAIPAYRDAPL